MWPSSNSNQTSKPELFLGAPWAVAEWLPAGPEYRIWVRTSAKSQPWGGSGENRACIRTLNFQEPNLWVWGWMWGLGRGSLYCLQ